jgi:hypothetical protein
MMLLENYVDGARAVMHSALHGGIGDGVVTTFHLYSMAADGRISGVAAHGFTCNT